jgi:hypothetical protein
MENLPVDVHIVPDGQEAIDFIAKAGSEPMLLARIFCCSISIFPR